MADTALVTRLLTKFRSVPNITADDCTEWLTTAEALHGNSTDTELLLLLAQGEGARNIALNVAHYFSYQDGDESVDKTMLTEQYLAVSADFLKAYNSYKRTTKGVTVKTPARADR